MEIISILALGLLFGIRHAFDADHLAAVATLAVRCRSPHETVRVGVAWGLAHALTLFTAGTVVVLADVGFSADLERFLEAAVGLMLIGLGTNVVRSALRNRVHIHRHRHGDHTEHAHIHAHPGGGAHDPSDHRHPPHAGLPRRAAAVGLVHGLAGSAALVLLVAGTADTLALGLAYLAVFGLGSTLGMAALSLTFALSLRSCAGVGPRTLGGLRIATGLVSVVVGAVIVADILLAAGWTVSL